MSSLIKKKLEENKKEKKKQKKRGNKKTKKMGYNKKNRIQGTNFRWVVPQLSPEVWDKKEKYKADLLDKLLASKTAKKGIRYYSLAIESHADGNPHLDLLLIFEKKIELTPTELDFLCQKHGDLTRYRNLNQAILNYGSKEDTPLSNCPDTDKLIEFQRLKHDPYVFFQERMLEDPFHFNLDEYCAKRKLFEKVKGYSAINSKLKLHQIAVCNLYLKDKPGIQRITEELIRRELTPLEQEEFYSWHGYQQIVDKINEIHQYGCVRPFKSKQLLIVGPPNTGKTSLNRLLSQYVSTYEIGVNTWWPRYQDNVYTFFSWNEFSLKKMPYTELLKLLEGTVLNLEQKGGHGYRENNQLIIMNSNLTAIQHLRKKFYYYSHEAEFRQALQNFPARVEQLVIPRNKNLFLLIQIIKRIQSE